MVHGKKHSVVAGLLFVLVFLTMFSRNYLGVHTPQDVLVGFISTAVMMYLTGWLELWSEKTKKRPHDSCGRAFDLYCCCAVL